jgi:hypothetical protein
MTFSYVNHPTMKNRLIPITEIAYKKLGVRTQFVPQPSNRNLRLVESGDVDGDVGYMKIVSSGYNNLIALEPPVVSGIFVLLCRPELICAESVLFDSSETMVTTSATVEGAQKRYQQPFQINPYIVNNINVIPDFISKKRFRYALYATSQSEMWRVGKESIKHIELFDASVHHTLNEKYESFVPLISAAIAQAIVEFDATTSSKENP